MRNDLDKTAFAKEYLNHSALNLGMAARDLRWLHNHSAADKVAPEGSAKHIAASLTTRIPSLISNLYYTALPPQLHHSDEELKEIKEENPKDNFLIGYAPWKYRKKKDGGGNGAKTHEEQKTGSLTMRSDFQRGFMEALSRFKIAGPSVLGGMVAASPLTMPQPQTPQGSLPGRTPSLNAPIAPQQPKSSVL